jgi:hypothetical protein
MKVLILLSYILLNSSVVAFTGINIESSRTRFGIKLLDLISNCIYGKGCENSPKIIHNLSEDDCAIEYLRLSSSWENHKPELFSAIHYSSKIRMRDINIDIDYSNLDHRDMISDRGLLQKNSWTPSVIPHLNQQCSIYWKITDSRLIDYEDQNCRVTTISFQNFSYNMLFCSGNWNAYVDHFNIF